MVNLLEGLRERAGKVLKGWKKAVCVVETCEPEPAPKRQMPWTSQISDWIGQWQLSWRVNCHRRNCHS